MLSPNTASFCCVAVHISEVILSLCHIRNMTHESTAHEHNNSSCAHDRHLVSSNLESIKVFHWYSAQEKKHQERGDFRRNIRIAETKLLPGNVFMYINEVLWCWLVGFLLKQFRATHEKNVICIYLRFSDATGITRRELLTASNLTSQDHRRTETKGGEQWTDRDLRHS